MPIAEKRVHRPVPLRALILSLAALLVPAGEALLFPVGIGSYGPLLWLLALVPAFLLAYYRAWRGVATALAAGMATLSVTEAVANAMGRGVPDLLLGVVVAYVAIALGIGWLAERLHRDRDEFEDMALTDILTHLPNRRHARLFLENEFAAAQRGRALAVVLFDLDGFKSFNDGFGHQAGDEALRSFADILTRTTRRMNLSGRFGGEEFVSVLAGSDSEGAMVFADRVRSAMSERKHNGQVVSVSAGVATFHPSMRTPDELLAAADQALYRAKREGRNCVRLFGHSGVGVDEGRPWLDVTTAVAEYPREPHEIGRTPPPPALLPQVSDGSVPTGKREAARTRTEQARQEVVNALRALVRAAEVRDPYKQGHSERVARYALVLAGGLDASGERVDLSALWLACTLHDLGKLTVPDWILNKEGSLSADDLQHIRAHPRMGRRMLEPLLHDEAVLSAVSSHHERWDGSGYPDGLAGERIPLLARLVGASDALEAMTSDRAHRRGLSWEDAMNRMRELSGVHFDPEIVKCVERSQESLRAIYDEQGRSTAALT